MLLLLGILYFNSIKVQLRRTLPTSLRLLNRFQFHKGTIKTHCFGIYNILVSNRVCGRKVKKSY